jgi:hypothetical protein
MFEDIKPKKEVNPHNPDAYRLEFNNIKYFYPYFKEINLNWDNELEILLQEVQKPQNGTGFWKILLKSISKLQDAHAFATPPESVELFATFPFITARVGGKYVITQVQDSTFKVGDEIIALSNI